MRPMSQSIRRLLLCQAFAVVWQTGACTPPSGDGGNGPSSGPNAAGIFALSPDNAVVVAGANSTAESMVAGGSSSAAIAAALVAQLSADIRVAQATIDPGSGFVVAHFHDGETQTFQAIGSDDLAEGDIDPVDNLPNEDVAIAMKPFSTERAGHLLPAQLGGLPTDVRPHVIPGLSTALMASAMPHFHPKWASCNETEQIKGMLESRGYTVKREPLQLRHFLELHKYGVLLIETHGCWLDSSVWKDIMVCGNIGSPDVPNCGGAESLFGLLTTTTTTDEPAENHREDINTGRLILHNVPMALVVNEVPVQTVTKQYYAVTSLYLRQHVTEPYPDGMLIMVNACKAFHNGSSSIGSYVLSKSRSSQFLAWNEKLRYQYAAKGALNLFQLMTASNEKLDLEGIPQLKKRTPPIGVAVDLNWALASLGQAGLDTAPTGAVLERRAAATESGDLTQSLNLLLMPYAMEWTGPSSTDPKVRLGLLATDNATVAIGGTSVTATPEMLCCSNSWFLSDSPNLFGNIVPWYFSRYGTPRPLRRWKPVITVKSNGGPGMQYEVRFQPQGRASINGDSFRASAWSKAPVPRFDLLWDKGGSSLWWKVTGESDTDEAHYAHQGTGTRVFGAAEGGGMRTADGKTAIISVDGVITYTTTRTQHSDGSSEQTEYEQQITTSFEVPLRANWSVAGGSEAGTYDTTTWTEFFADPPFDNTEPR